MAVDPTNRPSQPIPSAEEFADPLLQLGEVMKDVFSSLNVALAKQTAIMNTTAKYLKDIKGADREDKLKGDLENKKNKNTESDQGIIRKTLEEIRDMTKKAGSTGSFMVGGISAGIAGAATLLMKGGLMVALAPYVGEYVKTLGVSLLEQTNPDISPDMLNSFGSALQRGGTMALIGGIFGRKAAALFGVAGVASSALEEYIGKKFDEDGDGIVSLFGKEIDVSMISYGITAGIAMAISSAKVRQALATAVTSKLVPMMTSRVGVAGAVAGLTISYGDEITDFISSQTGLGAGESGILTMSVQGATVGAMFGPQGAVVGAIAGFVTGLGSFFMNWLRGNQEEAFKESFRKFRDLEDKLKADPSAEVTPDMLATSQDAAANAGVVLMDDKASPERKMEAQKIQDDAVEFLRKNTNASNADLQDYLTLLGQNVSQDPEILKLLDSMKYGNDEENKEISKKVVERLRNKIGSALEISHEDLEQALSSAIWSLNMGEGWRGNEIVEHGNIERLRTRMPSEISQFETPISKFDPDHYLRLHSETIGKDIDRMRKYLEETDSKKEKNPATNITVHSTPTVNAPVSINHGGVGGTTILGGSGNSDLDSGYGVQSHYGR